MLVCLQQIRDSAALMHVFRSSGAAGMTHPDVMHILAVWRDRLPSPADGADVWDALLSWRNITFNIISELAKVETCLLFCWCC